MQLSKQYICPVEATTDVIGGKWKAVILYYLLRGTLRFGELKCLLPTVTQRMLTLQLCELERDGIIYCKIYDQVPQKRNILVRVWSRLYAL